MRDLRRVKAKTYSPNCTQMHLLIEYIWRGRAFFIGKMYGASELNLHIPPSLQAVLVASLHVLDGFSVVNKAYNRVYIHGMLCVPNYENRIVISHPDYAIFENEPMVVIELENMSNYPTYFEIN